MPKIPPKSWKDLTTISVRHTVRDAWAVVKLYPIAQGMDSHLRILSDWFEELRCSQLPFGELKVGGNFDVAREEGCDDSLSNHTDLFNQALIEEPNACLGSPDLEIVPHFHDSALSAPLNLSRMSENKNNKLPNCTSKIYENLETTKSKSYPISSNP